MNNRIKLLFCIDDLAMTGASKSLVSLLQVLDYSRYEVSLFLFCQSGCFLKDVPSEVRVLSEIPAYFMAHAPLKTAIKRGLKRGWLGMVAWRMLGAVVGRKMPWTNKINLAIRGHKLEGEYDIAIAYCCSYAWSFIVDKVRAAHRVAWLDTDHNQVMGAWRSFARPERWDRIACVCEGEVQSLANDMPEFKQKICAVHNIIDKKAILVAAQASVEGIGLGRPVLMTVGRVDRQKSQDIIIEIARELVARKCQFDWYLVGPGGPIWEGYKQNAGWGDVDRFVHYVGEIGNPYSCMRGCDLYVQPSRWEGWGLTVTEAVAIGKPVVVSDIPPFREQISDGENGWIVPFGVREFADKIEACLSGACRLTRQGEWLQDYSRPVEFDTMCSELMKGS